MPYIAVIKTNQISPQEYLQLLTQLVCGLLATGHYSNLERGVFLGVKGEPSRVVQTATLLLDEILDADEMFQEMHKEFAEEIVTNISGDDPNP